MKKIILLIVGLIVTFNLSYSQNDIDNYRNNEITKEEIYSHIKYLASDELEGRFSGSNGDRLAGNYIAKEFKYYNLIPAGDSLYYQKFTMKGGTKIGETNSFELFYGDENHSKYKLEKDYIPLVISSNGTAEGDLVFAGYGIYSKDIDYNDYKDGEGNIIDVKGKIVVILDGSPKNKYLDYEDIKYKAYVAKSKGAAGMIIIFGINSVMKDELIKSFSDAESMDAGIPIMSIKTSIIEKVISSNGKSLSDIESNINNNLKPGAFILKDSKAKFETSINTSTSTTANIIGYLEGSDPVLKNEVIVIGAHFDHLGYGSVGSLHSGKEKKIHYGADDNASGSAGVMELAEKLSSMKSELKRSYLFICFSGEEEGLLGSAHFTKSDLFNKYNIVSMINLDMIGRLNNKNSLIISGTGTSSLWDSLLTATNKSYNFVLSLNAEGMGGSDHTSFYVKNKPVLFFFTGIHEDYHKPSDTFDKINLEGEAKVLDMVYDVTMSIDSRDAKPEFVKKDKTKKDEKKEEKKEEKKGTGKVYTGTIPDFTEEVEGYKISGVTPDSPADKSGLQSGDVIIKFGERDIKNIQDYMYALGEHTPGEELDIVILRGTEKITVRMILGTKK